MRKEYDQCSRKYIKENRNILELSYVACYYTNRQKDTNYSICMLKALVWQHQGFSIPFVSFININIKFSKES